MLEPEPGRIGIWRRAVMSRETVSGKAARIYVLQFSTLLVAFAISVVTARTLGPSGKGTVDLFRLITTAFVPLVLLGLETGFVHRVMSKQSSLQEVNGTGSVAALGLGVMMGIVGIAGLPLWRDVLPGLEDWMIVLGFALAPAVLYQILWTALLVAVDRAVVSYTIAFVATLITVPVVLFLWLSDDLTPSVVIGLIAGTAMLDAGVGWVALRRISGRPKFTRSILPASLAFGFPVFVSTIANLLHFRVDQLLVNGFIGTADLGVYAVSVRIAEMLFLLDSAIAAAALSRVASSEHAVSYRLTRRLSFAQVGISGGVGLVAGLAAIVAIPAFYGAAYRGAVVPLLLLVPGIACWSAAKIVSNYLVFNRRMGKWVGRVSVLGLGVNVVANVLLLGVAGLGIQAAAAASSFSYLVVAVLTVHKAWRTRPGVELAA